MSEIKKWHVWYSHADGRNGTAKVTTKVEESGAFKYGNGKCGAIIIDGCSRSYDLRYCHDKNLHMAMIEEYFGDGLVKVTEEA